MPMIVARGGRFPYRVCKNCSKHIHTGELCVCYKRTHGCSYHCYACAIRLNPAAVEEYIYASRTRISA